MPKKISHEKILPFLGKATDKDVAEKFGISLTTVRDIRKKHDISPFVSNGNWDKIDPLLGTRPDRELADFFGMSQGAIVQRRQKLGISPFDTSRQRLDWAVIDPTLGTESDTDIAARFGASISTITRRRNTLGIKPFIPQGQAKGSSLKKNAGLSLSEELLQAIADLPQIKTPEDQDGWSKSYFVEQVLRNALGMPADYSHEDIAAIGSGSIIV